MFETGDVRFPLMWCDQRLCFMYNHNAIFEVNILNVPTMEWVIIMKACKCNRDPLHFLLEISWSKCSLHMFKMY